MALGSPYGLLLVLTDGTGAGITGTLAATEGSDVTAIAGVLAYTGTLAATEGADVTAINGTASAPVTGTLAATEGADVTAITGSVVVTGIEYLGGMPSGKRKRHPMDLTPRYVEEMRRQQEALKAPRKPLPPIPKPPAAQPVRAMEITANQAANEALAARRRRDEDALNVILALLDD